MDRIVAVIYPYEQETALETHLASRVQVERFINPSTIDAERYDGILLVGEPLLFQKGTLDKIAVLSTKYSERIRWVYDTPGQAAEVLQTLDKRSSLGAFQVDGVSELTLTHNTKFTIIFKHDKTTLSHWRMKVKSGGSGVAELSFFDVEFGGKLLRTYDVYLSEFRDGWFEFRLPNPIFKANKKFAATFKVKSLVGAPPLWIAHQGWSSHAVLKDGRRSDFVPCFETL